MMKITKEKLKEWNACRDGFSWFIEHFPSGEAEYQIVLDALAEDNKQSYAHWLMNKAGPDDSVLEVETLTGKNVFFAGSIKVSGNIKIEFSWRAGWGIEAGEGIEAGHGIEAGWVIKAGHGIEAGLGIKAGEGMGIFAGLNVKVCDWEIHASVSAKTKPENLISGFWSKE